MQKSRISTQIPDRQIQIPYNCQKYFRWSHNKEYKNWKADNNKIG